MNRYTVGVVAMLAVLSCCATVPSDRDFGEYAPQDCLVSVCPDAYPKQKSGCCGGYTIKAVLSAYGLDDGRTAEEYLKPIHLIVGGNGPRYLSETLGDFGLDAPVLSLKALTDSGRVRAIKAEIDLGHPVVLLIGQARTPKERYSLPRAQGPRRLHWVSVWGYGERYFYVYDSTVDQLLVDSVPVGNKARVFDELLRGLRYPVYLFCIHDTYLPVQIPESQNRR